MTPQEHRQEAERLLDSLAGERQGNVWVTPSEGHVMQRIAHAQVHAILALGGQET